MGNVVQERTSSGTRWVLAKEPHIREGDALDTFDARPLPKKPTIPLPDVGILSKNE